MEGQVHFFPVMIVVLGAILVMALARRMLRREPALTREVREVECPVHERRYEAEVVHDASHGCYTGVTRCAHFEKPEQVACERACLVELNVAEIRDHAGVATT